MFLIYLWFCGSHIPSSPILVYCDNCSSRQAIIFYRSPDEGNGRLKISLENTSKSSPVTKKPCAKLEEENYIEGFEAEV